MSRMHPALIVVLSLAAMRPISAQNPPAAPPRDSSQPARDTAIATGTAIIRGRVIAAGTEKALAHVEVRAVSGPLRINKAVLTDASGRYEIAKLPAGRFTVNTNKANYVRVSYGQQRVLGPGKPIELANGQVVERIDFVLQHTGAITGRITDEYGDPAPDVQVMPMRYAMVNGERRPQSVGQPGVANDLGEYRIFGLAPGTYFVSATLRNNNFGDSNDRSTYSPTYYPGTGSMAQATRLTVAAGQTISGINLTLQPVASVRISGVALDSQGRPMRDGFVNMMPRVGAMMMAGGSQVKADGTFSIGGVAPGDYTLRVSSPGNGPDESAVLDVSVGGGDVSDLQLVVVKPSTIRGRVVFEPGDVKPPAASALRVFASHPNTTSAIQGNSGLKNDLTFDMKTSPGHVMIRATVNGTGDWQVKRVLVSGLDVTDAGVDIAASSAVDDVVVEMTSRHAELSGTVRDAAGDSVRDCLVIAFAQDPSRWTAQTRYYRAARPDIDGVFHLRPVAGDYYIVAFDDPENAGLFNDPDVLRQLMDRAKRVSIADGEKTTMDLALSAPPVY